MKISTVFRASPAEPGQCVSKKTKNISALTHFTTTHSTTALFAVLSDIVWCRLYFPEQVQGSFSILSPAQTAPPGHRFILRHYPGIDASGPPVTELLFEFQPHSSHFSEFPSDRSLSLNNRNVPEFSKENQEIAFAQSPLPVYFKETII